MYNQNDSQRINCLHLVAVITVCVSGKHLRQYQLRKMIYFENIRLSFYLQYSFSYSIEIIQVSHFINRCDAKDPHPVGQD